MNVTRFVIINQQHLIIIVLIWLLLVSATISDMKDDIENKPFKDTLAHDAIATYIDARAYFTPVLIMKSAWILLNLLAVYGDIQEFLNICALFLVLGYHPLPLLTLTPTVSHNSSLVCHGSDILSCDVALVNWNTINNFEDILVPTGEVLHFDFTMESLGNSKFGNNNCTVNTEM